MAKVPVEPASVRPSEAEAQAHERGPTARRAAAALTARRTGWLREGTVRHRGAQPRHWTMRCTHRSRRTPSSPRSGRNDNPRPPPTAASSLPRCRRAIHPRPPGMSFADHGTRRPAASRRQRLLEARVPTTSPAAVLEGTDHAPQHPSAEPRSQEQRLPCRSPRPAKYRGQPALAAGTTEQPS